MRERTNKKSIVFLLILLLIILIPKTSQAAGLSSIPGGETKTDTVSNLFKQIRDMETSAGTLGKSSNIDQTTFVDSSGNGIDCHMSKNTEGGAVSLLARSKYGGLGTYGPSTDTSTTNNNTGVFGIVQGTPEFSAGIYNNNSTSYNTNLVSADSRYKNVYDENNNAYPGDTRIETDNWGHHQWNYTISSSWPVSVWYRSGMIFQYLESKGDGARYSGSATSRAVVVCGQGL